ncbi:uncharacterized protein AFUA_6G14670 [Aspergillus fumigatus Af293]|uniref:C2H2-type domain-containing protein n=1 Tax=Aspergillus fumigatus (strain ATCC MYA-4609 / CBS 101355 / FGSC A1100 / Af293) TaxID=330879 RepID=Q4WL61_ASPFU|nr:hypothetical protein AFUA_6G14670 [Aspergillus fumigatus Af293]EAL89303.1 hypothetical protein AFUA_6G14670 [Aspergillus fumigatus Af293]
MGRRPAWDPTQGACVLPPLESAPMPGLPVYQGYCCPHCPYVVWALSNLPKHQRRAHPEAPWPCPGRPLAPEPGLPELLAVSYQQFFPAQAGSIWNRPIQIHLKPSTYQHYRQVWQCLICFAYRTSCPDQLIVLLHQLTTTQLAALD